MMPIIRVKMMSISRQDESSHLLPSLYVNLDRSDLDLDLPRGVSAGHVSLEFQKEEKEFVNWTKQRKPMQICRYIMYKPTSNIFSLLSLSPSISNWVSLAGFLF